MLRFAQALCLESARGSLRAVFGAVLSAVAARRVFLACNCGGHVTQQGEAVSGWFEAPLMSANENNYTSSVTYLGYSTCDGKK